MESNIEKKLVKLEGGLKPNLGWLGSQSSHYLGRLTNSLAVMGVVLQQPALFFDEIRNGIQVTEKIGMLTLTSTIFLAAYGAVLGSGYVYLSLSTAIAMPFLCLGSLAACIPVMYLLDVLSGSQRSLGQMIAVLLTSISTAAIVFFSFTPIMILFKVTGTVPQFFLLNVGILMLATLVGLSYVAQGLLQTALIDPTHKLHRVNQRLHLLWMGLFLVVGSQIASAMLVYFQRTGGFWNWLF